MAASHQVCAGLMFAETHTQAVQYIYRVKQVYYMGKTAFQDVAVMELEGYGKALFLDKKIQSAQLDEFMFHEPLVHPAMITHPEPRRVVVAGGGEGATLREVLRHQCVQNATMVDIDRELVELCEQYLPEWHQGSFHDTRTTLIYEDARKVVASYRNHFDAVVSDLTDPLEAGPSQLLFTKEFYQLLYDALTEEGVLAVQAGATDPLYPHLFGCLVRTLQEVFPIVYGYWAFVASFMLPWGFVLASKRHDPLALTPEEVARRLEQRGVRRLRYYSPFTHFGVFHLPPYLHQAIAEGRVLTDAEPFSWEA